MAGRAATAVKSKTKSKPRATAKSTTAKPRATVKATAGTKSKSASSKDLAPAKKTTATVKAPAKSRRRVKVETRIRLYWAVFNQNLKRVAVFEFDQKGEAEKRAAKLIKSSGDHHFIQKIKTSVPSE